MVALGHAGEFLAADHVVDARERTITGAHEHFAQDRVRRILAVGQHDFRRSGQAQSLVFRERGERIAVAFYNDCSDVDAKAAIARLVPEPAGPSGQPLRLSAERFGRVDKVYIHCARDNAISLARQREFAAKWPMRRSVTLDSGHSPFLSIPARLAHALGAELYA